MRGSGSGTEDRSDGIALGARGVRQPSEPEARERLAQALLATARSDAVAFQALYRLTASKLFGICLTICQDRTVAEDILQDVYVRAWTRAGTFDPARGSAIAWLAMIARNRSIDWVRSRPDRSHRIQPDFDLERVRDEAPLVLEGLIAKSDRAAMLACLADLEPRQRSAIYRAFFVGMTYADIARHEGVPLGTAKSWIRRGLMQIKARLDTTPVSSRATAGQAAACH